MAEACTITDASRPLQEEDRSLPAQWFRDERIYQLERRAIFSKLWILATHRSRFAKAGDYLKLEYAGYPYLVVKNKEGGFSAFHNVCRHRAFPLVHKETGSSTILGCKYHGWSYSSSTGALIKAPQFTATDGSPLIDREANGLFKLHVHVTDSGFIFVNFNAAPLAPLASESSVDVPTPVAPQEAFAMTKGTASADPHIPISLEAEEEARAPAPSSSPLRISPPRRKLSIPGAFVNDDDDEAHSDAGYDSDGESAVTAPDSTSESGSFEVPKTPGDDVLTLPSMPATAAPPAPTTEYTVRFEEHFGALPSEWNGFRPDDYEYAYSWTKVGAYNWKTLMDGYQECYHCHIAHPGFAKSLALETYAVSPSTNFARHTAENKDGPAAILPTGAREGESPPSFTFVFPTNGVTVTPMMWYMMRTVPVSATETRMEYDVFRKKTEKNDVFRKYMEFYEQVEIEDYDLCVATQRNLNSGIYSRGFLHPDKELGVLFYQSRVRAFVEAHLALEKDVGHELNPAQPASQVEVSCTGGKADPVCASMGVEYSW